MLAVNRMESIGAVSILLLLLSCGPHIGFSQRLGQNQEANLRGHIEIPTLPSREHGQRNLGSTPKEPTLLCYYASWSVYRAVPMNMAPAQADTPQLCSHLVYAFAGLDNDSLTLTSLEPALDIARGGYKQFVDLKKARNVKVLIGVGGWKEDGRKYSDMAASPETRRAFVDSALAFVEKHGFDGIDLNWFYPGAEDRKGREVDRENLVRLVEQLHAEFRPRGLILTAAVPASGRRMRQGYLVPRLASSLDLITVMAYDLRGVWQGSVDHHAPISSRRSDERIVRQLNARDSVQRWIDAGVDRTQLLLAVPFYGRAFTLIDQRITDFGSPTNSAGPAAAYTQRAGYWAYYEVCSSLIRQPGWTLDKDEIGTPYAHRGTTWVGFDDADYISAKGELVAELGIAGAAAWSVDMDDFAGVCGTSRPLLHALHSSLQSSRTAASFSADTANSMVLPASSGEDVPACREDGIFADPLDCASFRRCADGAAHHHRCQAPLVFDVALGVCNWPENVKCSRPYSYAAPTVISTAVEGQTSLFVCDNSDSGVFSVADDCASYVWCSGRPTGTNSSSTARGHQFTCGANLLFDPISGACSLAHLARCQPGMVVDVTRLQTTAAQTLTQGSNMSNPDSSFVILRNGQDKRVVCQFNSWAWRRPAGGSYVPEHVPHSLCTHIVYQHAVISASDGASVQQLDTWTDNDKKFIERLRSRVADDHIPLLLGVGGWTDSAAMGDKYSTMAADGRSRAIFVASLLELINQLQMDGVDLQWLFPGCWRAECLQDDATGQQQRDDKKNMALLVEELRAAMDGSGRRLLLTATISANDRIMSRAYDVPALNRYLDFVNVMAFDYTVAHRSITGLTAPVYGRSGDDPLSVDSSVRYLVSQGLDPSKMVLGVSLYGRTFTLKTGEQNKIGARSVGPGAPGQFTLQPGILAFHEICSRLQQGWQSRRAAGGEPYAFNQDQWVSYEDPSSLQAKSIYIKESMLGGAMVWTLDMDDFENGCCSESHALLKTLSRELTGRPSSQPTDSCQKPVIVTPPTPTRITTYDSGLDLSTQWSTTPMTTSSVTGGSSSTLRPSISSFSPTASPSMPSTTYSSPETSAPPELGSIQCGPDGFAPHPTDCGAYYRCTSRRTFLIRCSPGLHFNPVSGNCDWPAMANCQQGVTSPTPTPAASTSSTSVMTSSMMSTDTITTGCEEGTFSAIPGDCFGFRVCVKGAQSIHRCAPGLQWNQNILSCDYPENSVCNNKVNFDSAADGFKMVCYFTNWAMYRPGIGRYTPDNIDPSLCTHIVYGFAILNTNTHRMQVFDQWADLDQPNQMYAKVTALKQRGKKVLIGLGGWNDSRGDKYSVLVNSAEKRAAFVEQAVEFLREHNFDGLDLDWEYPKCWQVDCSQGPDSDKSAFALWVTELKLEFRRHGLLLSAAVSPSRQVIDNGYDVPALNSQLDWIAVMTYDFHGHWDKKTGHVSPFRTHPNDTYDYFNTQSAIEYWLQKGATPSRLVVGVPFYGQAFTLMSSANHGLNAASIGAGESGRYTRAVGFLAYYEICQRQKEGWTTVQDEEQRMGPYAYSGDQWVSFDDTNSVQVKADWIKQMKLGGGMVWALDLDDFNNVCGQGKYPLLSVLAKTLLPEDTGEESTPQSSMGTLSTSTSMSVTTQSSITQSPSSTSSQMTPQESDVYKVVCYFTNWAWYRPGVGKYLPSDIDPNLCTHIIYGFAVLNAEQSSIRPHDSWADLDNDFYAKVTEFKKKGIKVLLALGGWNDSAGNKYSKLVNDPARRRRFVKQAVEFVRKYNFDGLDLDWEYPKCWQVDCSKGPASDKQAFSAWIQELNTAFRPHNLLLTAAVSPNKKVIDQGYDVPALSKYLDFISVMTYDYHGHWDKKTGHVAPMYQHPQDEVAHFNANFTINYWIEQGADRRKIVMGMSMYGQSFALADSNANGLNAKSYGKGQAGQFTRSGGFLSYYEICYKLKQEDWSVVKDTKMRMGPYAYKGTQWFSFDDTEMIRYKSNYIKDMGLGGGMIWALDLDDFNNRCECEAYPLLKTINRVLRNYDDQTRDCPIEGQLQTTTEPGSTNSGQSSASTTASTTMLPPATGGACSVQNEYRPHRDCDKYMICDNNVYVVFMCPNGLHWNAQAKACDWPGQAGCERAAMTFTTSEEQILGGRDSVLTDDENQDTSEGTSRDQGTSETPKAEADLNIYTKQDGYMVVCYFTNWAWYRPGVGKYLPSDIDPNLCTHIIYGFAVLNAEQSSIRPHDSWADLDNDFYAKVTEFKKKGIKVLLALGGWNDSAGNKYSKLVNDPARRKRFVKQAVEFVRKYNFDGLDLDWEYPKCWQVDCSKGPASDKQAFSAWIQELSEAFRPHNLLLTAAVSPNKKVIDQGYDVPALSKYLDFISVMTYDYHGHWDKKTGHVAPMYQHPQDEVGHFNANFTINYWIEQGADRRKIVMGMSMYGQSFALADSNAHGLNAKSYGKGQAGQFTRSGGFLSYYEICYKLKQGGWSVVKDSMMRMGPYAYKGTQWFSFDDTEMIRYKSNYIKDMGLGGGMIWALDLDDFNNRCECEAYPLLKTINRVLRNYDNQTRDCPIEGQMQTTTEPSSTESQLTTLRPGISSSTMTSSTTQIVTAGSCNNEGQTIPDPNDCRRFWRCDNGRFLVMSCGAGLHFNAAIGTCDWPESAGCQITTSSTATTLSSPSSSTTMNSAMTSDTSQSATTSRPLTTSVSTAASTINATTHAVSSTDHQSISEGAECEENGAQFASVDCQKFYVCNNGQYMARFCAANTHYNAATGQCDWPQNAKCTGQSQIDGGSTGSEMSSSTSSALSTPAPVLSSTSTPQTVTGVAQDSSYKVVCYFTNWSWYRRGKGKYTPDDIDTSLCSHIVYGFAVLDSEKFTIRTHDRWADIDNEFYTRVTSLKGSGSSGPRVLIALGGWNDSLGPKYSVMVNSKTNRRRFIDSVVAFIERYNFDGLDLDWEYPKCWQVDCNKGPDSDKDGFSAWIRELHEEFAPRGWLLSAAVSPNKKVIDAGYDVPVLSQYLDFISVMTYDYHGHWDKKTGHVAPMYQHPEDEDQFFNLNFTIHYYLEKGAAPSKLIVGMPMHGQSFGLTQASNNGLNAPAYGKGRAGAFTRAAGFLSFYEICEKRRKENYRVVQDPEGRMGPYAYKAADWVSFDDREIIRKKSEYVRSMNLGGGMIWALDLDDFSGQSCGCERHPLLRTINRVLRDYSLPEPDCPFV